MLREVVPSIMSALMTILFCLIVLLDHPTILGNQDYKYIDQSGKEIQFPNHLPIFSLEKPGPWKNSEALIEPKVRTWIRKEGLEMIRILEIWIPYPTDENAPNRIKTLYVLDKDDLIIGYRKFQAGEKELFAKILINGIINHIQVYIESSQNGLWRKEYHFEFRK